MTTDFEQVRTIMRQLATICEGMWIERETLRNALITVYGVSPETIGESLTIAKDSPETKESARKAFAGMWKALEDESFEIVAEELMKELPKSDKPN